ncbi:MAG: ArsC/Spx/MgsR family protein [Planctomycetota bacterium]|jgi:arsenate reductase
MTVTVWFNPACSKCRAVKSLLEERGIAADYRHYLEQAPTPVELEDLLVKLDDPSAGQLLRTKDAAYSGLGLDGGSAADHIAAGCSTPSLINRPIVVKGDRAIVARPPELVLELL